MQIQIHCKCKYKRSANANTVHRLTTQLWPAVRNPMIQCPNNIGPKSTAHTNSQIFHVVYEFTNTVHIHFVTHRYYQSASQYNYSTTRKQSSHREWNPAPVEAQRSAPVLIGSLQSPLSFSGRLIANMFRLQYSLWPWRSSSSWPKPKFKSSWSCISFNCFKRSLRLIITSSHLHKRLRIIEWINGNLFTYKVPKLHVA